MELTHVPLLQVQRELYQLPRGVERFRAYLQTMVDDGTGDLRLPLAAMNPMGKDHLPIILDRLFHLGAEEVAIAATLEATERVQDEPGAYQVGLVVSDDLLGGWTNRYTSEFSYRFQQKAYHRRGWLAVVLWTSETYSAARVREEVLLCIYRAWYAQQHGYAQTLGEMLSQEEQAMRMAGMGGLLLEAEDVAYTREVLSAYLSRSDPPTVLGALFGDEAAHHLGYRPLGLSPRAGLALAQANALGATAFP